MKRFLSKLVPALVALTASQPAWTANPSPEAEMRSTWIATVFSIDWPRTSDGSSALKIKSTGNERQINLQKQALTNLLDSLAANNFNAAKLQIRARCDAMYKSSYEPWSSDLVDTRGMDPGYDPFEFFVEECHKRGLEAHAWINPYRYETSIGTFTGTPKAYRDEHPDWLIDVGSVSYLNPALPEVRQRICDVAGEIVTNYDVDGLLFDDYFYPQGISDQDAAQYQEYTAAGGKLGIKDWRRANINRMVREVYATVKSIKPWVRFGIGPAGITCSTEAQANAHGVPRCTSGSDYQYDGIYSDPLAWLEDRSIDYISPQIYWGIGYADADFDIIAKWWSDRMPAYRRHLFISKDISSLSKTGEWNGVPPVQHASGPGVTTFDQYRKQIELTREYSTDGEPGSVFYSAKFIYSSAPLFGHFLRTNVYARKALLPSMQWVPAPPRGPLDNVTLSGTTLSWKAEPGLRYAVFGHNGADREVLGFTYGSTFDVPAAYASAGNVSVAVYDRFGNVYSLRTVGVPLTSVGTPTITAPGNGQTVYPPADVEWTEVADAESYILEVAVDPEMTNLIETRRLYGTTTINTTDLENLRYNTPLYARVRALADNATSTPSATITFNAIRPEILTPMNDSVTVNLTPEITWNTGFPKPVIRIAEDAAFKKIVVESTGGNTSWTVPKYTLQSNKSYWTRISVNHDGREIESQAVRFITPAAEELVPTILWPKDNGVLHSNEYLGVEPIEGARQFRIEVAANESFPSRSLYVATLSAGSSVFDTKAGAEIKIGGKNLTEGTTYFARARATYNGADGGQSTTEYSPVLRFTYSSEKGNGVTDVEADAAKFAVTVADKTLFVTGISGKTVTVTDTSGREVTAPVAVAEGQTDATLPCPPRGVYLVSDGRSTVKAIVR